MGWGTYTYGGLKQVNLGSLDLTGTNETLRAKPQSSLSVSNLQKWGLSEVIGPAEVWRPVGISYVCTTGITVTNAVVTLWQNGVAVTGATATLPIVSSGANWITAAFANYSAATITDAAGDAWSLKVTTTSTAGVVNPVYLWYATIAAPNVSYGVANP